MVVSSDEEPVDASAVRPVARQPLASKTASDQKTDGWEFVRRQCEVLLRHCGKERTGSGRRDELGSGDGGEVDASGRGGLVFSQDDAGLVLAKEMERALSVIVDVALKSKNLKGGCVRALKTSAALLGEAKEVLLQRTSGEENEILRARLEEEKKSSLHEQWELDYFFTIVNKNCC
ncbi:hypothetical protein KGM_204955 [Danaus plexippus plexippus]|uniref:Uncharacterized protein n=1 Tax=Danaus plexippus plexippus TaxID=278856 RepID=A0A212F8V1_DANPL|nr:hypothetical protein KGM_204955 [Danaus plexippus plexippus]